MQKKKSATATVATVRFGFPLQEPDIQIGEH